MAWVQPDVLGGAGLGQLLCAPLRGLWGSCNGSGPHGRAVSPPTQRTHNLTHGNSQRHQRGTCDTQRQTHTKHAAKPFATRAHTHTHRCPSLQTLVFAQTHLCQRRDLQLPNTHQSPHTNPRCHQPAWRTWEAKWRWTVAAEQRPSVDSTRHEEPWRPPCPHTGTHTSVHQLPHSYTRITHPWGSGG